MALTSELSVDKKSLLIELDKTFDFSKVQDFKQAYEGTTGVLETVIVDLRETEYMDSSALGMLLNMQKVLASHVTSFQIINCRPQIQKVLKISRFDKKFEIE